MHSRTINSRLAVLFAFLPLMHLTGCSAEDDRQDSTTHCLPGVQFALNGDLIVYRHSDALRLSGIGSGAPVRTTLKLPRGALLSTADAKASNRLLLGRRIIDVVTGKQSRVAAGISIVQAILTADGGKVLATGCADVDPDCAGCAQSFARLWDADTGKVIQSIGTFRGRPQCVALAPDEHAAFVAVEGRIHEIDLQSSQEIRTFTGGDSAPTGLQISPDGKVVAAASQGWLTIWDRQTRRILWEFHDPEIALNDREKRCALAFLASRNGLIFASASCLRVFNVADGRMIVVDRDTRIRDASSLSPIGVSSDEAYLAVWSTMSLPHVHPIDALFDGRIEPIRNLPGANGFTAMESIA